MRYAIFAYVAWGFFPAFWKLFASLPATEVLCHRIVWTLAFYSAYLIFRRERLFAKIPARIWIRTVASGGLLFINWYLYIYAVNANQVIEVSLGYFISPLINVALGVLILREKLSPGRWLALFVAMAGVIWLSTEAGRPPWIALTIALVFGLYGLLRKTTPVDSLRGGQLETLVMLAPAALIAWLYHPEFHWPSYSPLELGCLIASGAVTGIPLIWFANGLKIVPLNLLGFLQYIAPTLQFLMGVIAYSEPFGRTRLVGFLFIWASLIIFAMDLWRAQRKL